eukprot:gb/GECH01004455.1/.p1 GENE.gb/GECH01004455.1/~~gb/GECH01004455.1/.p1  ORF type:complete len:2081 (+),score=202.62 gb/GECH01004455.1/:1-6243(+)
MGSVLFVILTDVLPERQDKQAVGRCGRNGKAGVVQYILAKKDGDLTSSPEAVHLHRKIKKDSHEAIELQAKTNRIRQYSHDGFVLDFFCDYLPIFVKEWMMKLFPTTANKKKKDTTKPGDDTGSDGDDDESISVLEPVVAKWFSEYVTQAWAYWRGYGGSRRQPGDVHKHFEVRMGLASPIDLPKSDSPNPLQRFATRFWRFACVLRLNSEALYTLAKTLLSAENNLPVMGLCIDILNRASSDNAFGSVDLKLPPENNEWQLEFSGNAALLFARLSNDPEQKKEGIRRAIKALENNINRYTNYNNMNKKTTAEKLEISSNTNRDASTYYHVQREEITRQLIARKESLQGLMEQPNDLDSKFKHFSVALKNQDVAYVAYCLGYGFCEVVFEWYVGIPFTDQSEKTKEWASVRMKTATELGATPRYTTNTTSGGSGQAEVRTQEQVNKFEKEGTAIMERLKSESNTQLETNNSDKDAANLVYQWETSAPTHEDIQASQRTMWQAIVDWLEMSWAWMTTLITASLRKHRSHNQQGNHASQEEEAEKIRNNNPIWAFLYAQMAEQAKQQDFIDGNLVEEYIDTDAQRIIGLVHELGTPQRQTDLYQEAVEIRSDGKSKEEVSRSDAMDQAKEEAADQIYLREETFPKEDMHLISKTLTALGKMASKQELEGYDNTLHRMLESITQYNEFAQEGKVDKETAKNMNAAMKALWESTRRFALDHGAKIEDLQTPLANYKIMKTQNEISENVKEVKETIISVVEKPVSWVWKGLNSLWGFGKKVVNKVVKVVQQTPVIRESVNFVTERVVNPVYRAAKKFFDSVKETFVTAGLRIAKATGYVFKKIFETISIAVTKLGELASKAWNWLEETYFWKTLIQTHLMTGFNWVASMLNWLFVNALMPIATWIWKRLTWLWTKVQPILTVFASRLFVVWQVLKGIYDYLRYWFQGAGEIYQDFIWGTEYDIIDVENNQNRVTRFRMRLRAALRRVWASSWLQWGLDPSIRLGLDQDAREHVQERQSRAHNDFLRRDHLTQQQKGMVFAVIGVVLSFLMVFGAILSGIALLPAAIGFLYAAFSSLLQYASMELEADMSVDQERKRDIQNIISIIQSVVLIASVIFGLFATANQAVIAGSVVSAIGSYVSRMSTWLQKIADALRAEQKAKSTLQQIDKILKLVGISSGAGVLVMEIHDSLLGMLAAMFDAATSALSVTKLLQSLKKKILNVKNEQEEQQQQEEEEEEEEEDDNSSKKKPVTTVNQKKTEQKVERTDGWNLEKINTLLSASTDDKSKSPSTQSELVRHGSASEYVFTPPNGDDPIHITIEKGKDKQVVKFSRELTPEEKDLFDFCDDAPSMATIEKLFQKGSANVVRYETIESNSATYFNKNGQQVKKQLSQTTEDGEVRLTQEKGKFKLMVQPNGDPKPSPLYLDLQGGGEASKKIRGEVSEKHLKLLAEFLGSDDYALNHLMEKGDLPALEALAKKNYEDSKEGAAKTNQGTKKQGQYVDNNNGLLTRISNAVRGATKSASDRIRRGIVMYLSSFGNSIIVNGALKYVWKYLISKRTLETWVANTVKNIFDKVQTWIPSCLIRWIGLQTENTPAAEAPQDTPVEEPSGKASAPDENSRLVERLFKALLLKVEEQQTPQPNQSSGSEEQDLKVEAKLVDGILKVFQKHNSVEGAVLNQAVGQLVTQFRGEQDYKMSDEEKTRLQKDIGQHGIAKALYDWLYQIAAEKQSSNNQLPTNDAPNAFNEKSKNAIMYEHMKRSNAGYSRRNTRFKDSPEFKQDDVVKKLAKERQVSVEAVKQHLSSEQIQADLESFLREGDREGLNAYIHQFLSVPMPEELKEMWEKSVREIDTQRVFLIDRAWGQYSDETVAKTLHKLVGLMSQSVTNLRVENKVESPIDEKIEAQKEMFVKYSQTKTPFHFVDKGGKYRSELNKAAMAELHESHVRKILKQRGHEIIDAKLPSNTGIDILTVKRNAFGEVIKMLVVECKATFQKNVKFPKLSKTKAGKQLESSWIAEKMNKMYEQGGELREAAILMRKNLNKIETVIAFEKDGLNSWAHQDRVPVFNPAEVERLLQKANWDGWESEI